MINNNETTTPSLSDDQKSQLNAFHSQLASLDSQIMIYSGNLANLKIEVVKTTKERDNLNSSIPSLQESKDNLEKKITEIRESISAGMTELDTVKQESKKILDKQNADQVVLDERDSILRAKEAKFDSDRVDFDRKANQLAEESASLESKKNALLEVIKTI